MLELIFTRKPNSNIELEGDSGEKKLKEGYEKKFFSNFQICHNPFLYLKTQPIGAWKPQRSQFLQNFGYRYFCSLFTGTWGKFGLYATGLFIPKASKLLTRED